MITVRIGNLFESDAQTLVNTVNCVGVMGKGIALEFKERFPDMYEDYVRRCRAGQVKLGQPYLYKRLTPPWILNFPTKDHRRCVSRIQDIIAGLRYLAEHYRDWGISSLAVPPLGCGQGQLDWSVVGPILYRHVKQLDIPVVLFAPPGTPSEQLEPGFLDASVQAPAAGIGPTAQNRVAPAWVALVEILHCIEQEPYHWPVGRTTFQKIAYFATECGIPTGLQYQRGSYGPYAKELKRHITALVNNGLVREERLGRMFAVRTGETFPDARRLYRTELATWQQPIDRIADLFLRMNTRQAELAATVHFAAAEARNKAVGELTEMDVLREVMEWKQRRRPPFDRKEVAATIRHLNMLGWISAKASEELPVTEEDLLNV